MVKNNSSQNKYSLNLFLNEYFNILVISIVIIIFIVAYFLLIGPKFNSTMAVIRENIETQEKIYVEQEKKLNDLKIIKDVHDKINPADLNKFNSILPDPYIKEQLFGELEEIVISGGFLVKSIAITSDEITKTDAANANQENMPTIGGSVASERIGKITITVSIGAVNYSGFKNILRTIESNSRLFDVESVVFSESENSALLQLVTYYYKPLQ